MKVLFEEIITGQEKVGLSIEQIDKEVTISIDYETMILNKDDIHLDINLDKKQLSDFIGSLLHIQAKMRR